jgi:predicted 3-demethylubiquinone-9 3-methyltransferase (glyoxalase superfamily)
MQKIIPNLWFEKDTEEVVDFYTSLFTGSSKGRIMRYDKAGAEASGQKEGDVMTISFKLAGQEFIAINGGPYFKFTPAVSLSVSCKSEEEVDKLYEKLAENGQVLMALDKYPFAPKYAWINDKYGLSWQIILAEKAQRITPALMFVKENAGKAKEAMEFYISVFKDGQIMFEHPYGAGTSEKEDTLAHAEFKLFGQDFIAMDSGIDHKFNFTPAISFLVNCADQKEIDEYWEALSADPSAEQCGWLKDKYGLSWQIVPSDFDKIVDDPDKEKVSRIMKEMYGMKKIDIEKLKKAGEGDAS